MLRLDDVESLSRLLAGELSEPEASALRVRLRVEPELRTALERLRSLEAMTLGRGSALDEELVDRAAARAIAPRRRWGWAAVGMAAAAAVAVAVGWNASFGAPRADGPLVVDGRALRTRFPSVGAKVVAAGGSGRLVTRDCDLALGPSAELTCLGTDRYALEQGTVVAAGDAEVLHGDDRVLVSGRAIISTEPENAFLHATPPVVPISWTGGDMSKRIGTWNVATAAGAALAVWVVDGRAEVRADREPPRMLLAGESWMKPRRAPAPEVVASAKGTPSRALKSSSSAVSAPRDGEALDLDQVNERVIPVSDQLARCFEGAQKQDPKLEGKIDALLTIDARGHVAESTIAGSYSLNHPFVASCVLQVLNGVEFPAPKGGGPVQLSYPLEFKPRGKGGEVGPVGSVVVLPGKAPDGSRPMVLADRDGRSRVEVGGSPSLGPADAKVTIVAFSEAECQFCVRGHSVEKQLLNEYAGRVRLVFKHLPMAAHVKSRPVALAAVAAQEQGKFWEFMDRVFAEPNGLDPASLERHAVALGLDMARFRACVAGSGGERMIAADEAQAELVGVKGVPSYYVNGREVVGVRPIEQFREIIDEELAKSR